MGETLSYARCTAWTAKGNQCSRGTAFYGALYCSQHLKKAASTDCVDVGNSEPMYPSPEIDEEATLICTVCGEGLQMVGGGYTRTYYQVTLVDGLMHAYEDYPASFSDEGDGDEWLECGMCLARHGFPDHDDIEFN